MNGAAGNPVAGRLGRLTDSKLAPYLAALTALVIAAVFSFGIWPGISVPHHAVLDPDQHGNLAYGILKNHTFSYYPDPQPTVERGPAYPALIALVLVISNGWWPYSVQAAQCVMSALTCLMAYWVSRVLWSRRAAAFVALTVAVHPVLVWYTSRIWVETTAAFLFTSIVAASLCVVAVRSGKAVGRKYRRDIRHQSHAVWPAEVAKGTPPRCHPCRAEQRHVPPGSLVPAEEDRVERVDVLDTRRDDEQERNHQLAPAPAVHPVHQDLHSGRADGRVSDDSGRAHRHGPGLLRRASSG